jgi:hypothetical protein
VLASLGLDGNRIGVMGAVALARWLEKTVALTSLTLGNAMVWQGNSMVTRRNEIRAEGACAIAHALHKNASLTHLKFGCDNISDAGAVAVATALAANSTLRCVLKVFLLESSKSYA